MNSLIYTGVIFAGAVTLVIDAYKNYEQSLDTVPFEEYPILKDVKVSKLCTRRERNIGFMFYSLLYLVTYAVVLSSAELYELLQNVTKTNSQIGPPSELIGIDNDPLSLINTQYGKPIFVSAAIIALFSLGAFKPIETTMRSLAHRLAGVPRGVYAVIEELRSQDFNGYQTNDPTPLLNRFENSSEASYRQSNDSDQLPMIKRALRAIDYIAPTITGQSRVQYFPMVQLASLDTLSSKLEKQLAELRSTLENEPREGDGNGLTRGELTERIINDSNDTIALMAVHFLRNNRAMKEQDRKRKRRWRLRNRKVELGDDASAMDRIYESIKRGYRVEHNSFGMSLLGAFVLSMVACCWIYFDWSKHESPIRPEKIAGFVEKSAHMETLFGKKKINLHKLCANEPPQLEGNEDRTKNVSFDKPTATDKPIDNPKATRKADNTAKAKGEYPNADSCRYVWTAVVNEMRNERRKDIIFGSFWIALPMLMSVGLAAITAIFGREVRHEDASWSTDWTLKQIPFMRLFSMALIPSLVAVLGVVVGLLLQVLVDTQFQITQKTIVDLMTGKLYFILMHLGVGFIVAMGVLTLIDQHEHYYNEQTVLLAIAIALIFLGWYFLVVYVGYSPAYTRPSPSGVFWDISFETREAFLHASPGAIFLILFGLFLEITEDPENDKGNFFGKPLLNLLRGKKLDAS